MARPTSFRYQSAAGIIPWAGGPLGELIGEVIPKQRIDRIVSYLRKLQDRLQTLEAEKVKEALSDPNKIDLVETGGYQAARAISDERITQISEAVFNGIKAPEAEAIRRKRLLALLGEVDEDQIAILNAFAEPYHGAVSDAWGDIPRPPSSHMGSTTEIHDQNELYELGEEHLLRLGLIKQSFPFLRPNELPEIDKEKGRFKGDLEITYLGRMLFRKIGLLKEDVE